MSQWQNCRSEFVGLDFAQLDDLELLTRTLLVQLRAHDPGIEPRLHKKFEPQGVSIALMGSRCRVLVHSWPEHGVLTLDVSASNELAQPLLAACVGSLQSLR